MHSPLHSIDPDQTDDMLNNHHVMLHDEGDWNWNCPEVTQSQIKEEEVSKPKSNQIEFVLGMDFVYRWTWRKRPSSL